eukprot:7343717-Pyramimonas_sp.AAC.2
MSSQACRPPSSQSPASDHFANDPHTPLRSGSGIRRRQREGVRRGSGGSGGGQAGAPEGVNNRARGYGSPRTRSTSVAHWWEN